MLAAGVLVAGAPAGVMPVTGVPAVVVAAGALVTGVPAAVVAAGVLVAGAPAGVMPVTGVPAAVVAAGALVTGVPAAVVAAGVLVAGAPAGVVLVTGVPAAVVAAGVLVAGAPGSVLLAGEFVRRVPAAVVLTGVLEAGTPAAVVAAGVLVAAGTLAVVASGAVTGTEAPAGVVAAGALVEGTTVASTEVGPGAGAGAPQTAERGPQTGLHWPCSRACSDAMSTTSLPLHRAVVEPTRLWHCPAEMKAARLLASVPSKQIWVALYWQMTSLGVLPSAQVKDGRAWAGSGAPAQKQVELVREGQELLGGWCTSKAAANTFLLARRCTEALQPGCVFDDQAGMRALAACCEFVGVTAVSLLA